MSGSIQESLQQLARLQAAIPNQRDMPPISLPRPAPRQADPWEALTRLGFAMASSRNPSLFGQIGEAGLNVQDMQRQARRDAREEDELELNRVYREAQLNFQREQLRGDPTRLALAQAQLHEAQARLTAAERAGANAGREMQGIVSQQWTDDGRLVGIRRDGTTVELQAPQGARFSNPQAEIRRDQQWLGAFNAALQSLPRTPTGMAMTPPQLEAAAIRAANAAVAGMRNARPGAEEAPVAPPPPVVLDSITGRQRQ